MVQPTYTHIHTPIEIVMKGLPDSEIMKACVMWTHPSYSRLPYVQSGRKATDGMAVFCWSAETGSGHGIGNKNYFPHSRQKASKVLTAGWPTSIRSHLSSKSQHRESRCLALWCVLTSCVVQTELQSWFGRTCRSRPGRKEACSWAESSRYRSHCLHPHLQEKIQKHFINGVVA